MTGAEEKVFVFLDGLLVPADEASVSVFDRGFAYGDALIETIKLSESRPVFFREHLERLRQSMETLGIEAQLDDAGLRDQMTELAKVNGIDRGRLRLQLTRGTQPQPAGIDPDTGLEPTLLLVAESFDGYPESFYSQGMACVTVAANRGAWAALKTTNLVATMQARREALAAGADEALFTTAHGHLLEGAYTNIFFMAAGTLYTPAESENILPGIVRAKVMEVAGEMDIPVRQETFRADELAGRVTMAFLTSSLLGLCPVRSIDSKRLGPPAEPLAAFKARLRQLEESSIQSPGV